jgi:hypothetical protein
VLLSGVWQPQQKQSSFVAIASETKVLRIEAEKLGRQQESPCPVCSSTSGKKIDGDLFWELCHRFFDYGSRSIYYPPVYRIFPPSTVSRFMENQVKFDASLSDDIARIKKSADIGFRYNAPNVRRMRYTSVHDEIWTILDSDTPTEDAIITWRNWLARSPESAIIADR